MIAELEKTLNAKIIAKKALSGGSIASAWELTLDNGKQVFYKTANGSFFESEAHGLKTIASTGTIKVPQVIAITKKGLLLEKIEKGNVKAGFFEEFGILLAQLHKHSSKSFGLGYNNYIGATPQTNTSVLGGWTEFYWQRRLLPQLKLAENQKIAGNLPSLFIKLEQKIESIIGNYSECPALIHGDLWNGNYLIDKTGSPVLIDPAISYSNREAEFGMTTLFGGFSDGFYNAYNKEWPLEPDWKDRIPIYQLYHVMNHLNLFGNVYYNQAYNIIKHYTK